MTATHNNLGHARESAGISEHGIHAFAVAGLESELRLARRVLDVGCGVGDFGQLWRARFPGRIDGVDGVRFDRFRADLYGDFFERDFDLPLEALPADAYDAVFILEVIHYLENPRALVRRAASLIKPGGLLVLTTPNPLSLPSLMVLMLRGVFRSFQDGPGRYPGQKTAILPIDGERMAREAGLVVERMDYSGRCRLPRLTRPVQTWLPFLGGRSFSDNFRIVARKPAA